MSIANKQFLLAVIFACYHCVKTSVNDGPKFHHANGTVLKNDTEIKVLYGSPIELYCTGHADDLQVTRYGLEVLKTTIINQTTVKILEDKLNGLYSYHFDYRCVDTRRRNMTRVNVYVDSLPMVTNFHCISVKRQSINCSWASDNYVSDISLYYVPSQSTVPYSSSFQLCRLAYQPTRNYNCIWDKTHPIKRFYKMRYRFTFLINICNVWGCKNQTFVIVHNKVVKLGAPTGLEISWKTSHDAALQWFVPDGDNGMVYQGDDENGEVSLDYRITYLYNYGVYRYEINVTRNESISLMHKVGIEIKLPCANTFYEVRVSVKLHSAVGEEFWSDDAVTSFVTDEAEDPEVAVDPTCKPPEIEMTPSIMRYRISVLRHEMEKKKKEIKEYIRALKLKRDEKKLDS